MNGDVVGMEYNTGSSSSDENQSDSRDEDESSIDSDFKSTRRSTRGSKKSNSQADDLPEDVRRMLRARLDTEERKSSRSQSSSGNFELNSFSSRIKIFSIGASDEIIKRKGNKTELHSSSDSYQPSDSDFEPSAKAKKRRKAMMDDETGESSDENDISDDSDFNTEDSDKPRVTRGQLAKKKKTPTRRVVIEDVEEEVTKKKRHRRVKKDNELAAETKKAMRDEKARSERIAQRQKMYNNALVKMANDQAVSTKSVVLEYAEDGTPKLQVNPEIAKKLKKHQVEAVRFMWETTCESLDMLSNPEKSGSGCIIAHCMGLGKTLSVISFVHTLIANSDITGIKNCLILCPLNTVLNWKAEFERWVPEDDEIDVREMSAIKQNKQRAAQVTGWKRDGGILIIGYELYRRLTTGFKPKQDPAAKGNPFFECLVDPGPDIVICDEGHVLKSNQTAISKLTSMIKSKRRIVLTGTPLQNNLFEYHCMVSFVKPSLLGTKEEFANRFANPIKAGETKDATHYDERMMKRRISVLHKVLQDTVHRRGYEHLTEVLPTKLEYVLLLRLTPLQSDLYEKYLTDVVGVKTTNKITENEAQNLRRRLFADYHALSYVGIHPFLLLASKKRRDEKAAREGVSKQILELDQLEASSGSGDNKSGGDIIESDSDEVLMIGPDGEEIKCGSTKSNLVKAEPSRRGTRTNPDSDDDVVIVENAGGNADWFVSMVDEDMAYRVEVSTKFLILMQFLRAFEAVGDKTLIFSQSLLFLDLMETILQADMKVRKEQGCENDLYNTWEPDRDYFRIDGQVNASIRSDLINRFNSPNNRRARLFLISTRAGGIGVNLVGANRVIITDVSWNPSNDLQALFRAFRFGQKKPVYVYRLVAAGTMEERIYDRQVLKQSMSQRVVDEQQIVRHFSSRDIAELYQFDRADNVVTEEPSSQENLDESLPLADNLPMADSEEMPNHSTNNTFSRFIVPKDKIFAELLKKYPNVVKAYHDHDSLLAHQEDQVLDEDERHAAWEEYENEKKGLKIDADNPAHSHDVMTRAYMQLYGQREEEARFHSLHFLKEKWGPLRPAFREYCERNMAACQESYRLFKERASLLKQNEIMFQQQFAKATAGAGNQQTTEDVLRSLTQQFAAPPRHVVFLVLNYFF